MIADYSEVYGIAYDFKGHPVMDVNPCLPDTFFSFYLFGMQWRNHAFIIKDKQIISFEAVTDFQKMVG